MLSKIFAFYIIIRRFIYPLILFKQMKTEIKTHINKINTRIPNIKSKIQTGKRCLFSEEDIKNINDDIKHGAKHAQIMRAYNMTPGRLNYYIKKGKIPKTPMKINNEIIKGINELRAKKIPYEKIARDLNMSISYLFKLKKAKRII